LSELPTASLVLCREVTDKEATLLDGTSVPHCEGAYRLRIAQAAHKNLVKVPIYCFDTIEPCSAFSDYLRAKHAVGIVGPSGAVTVKGLKADVHLRYSDQLGLVINRGTERREHECSV
jgi:threonine dehydratase